MRIIKLSGQEFSDHHEINDFFETYLPGRIPPGKFRLRRTNPDASPKIREDGLSVGEWLVFVFNNEILWIGKAASGRMDNVSDESDVDLEEYPYFFLVDIPSLRKVDRVPLEKLEEELRTFIPNLKKISHGRGWPIVEELPTYADKIEKAILTILSLS